MPTLEQLPQVVAANPPDLVLLEQNGETCVVSVGTLLAPVQPLLTVASGVLLGRASIGPGGVEPVGVGSRLAIQNGSLGVDSTGLAPLDSPVFTGTPQAPTPVSGDVSTTVATTEYVQNLLLDKATVGLGARLPAIDGSAVQVSVPGGVARGLADSFSERFDVRGFGAVGNGVRPAGAVTIAAGSSQLQVAGAVFSAADVGKLIAVNGAGPQGTTLATRIAGVSAASVVVLAAPAATALAGVTGVVCYGSDDAPAIAAALAQAAPGGGEVVFPRGIYVLGAALNLPQTGSLRLVGAGPGATQLVAAGALTTGLVTKGTILHRHTQIADLRLDANALAPYALDLPCAEGYRIDRVVLSNGTLAGLRLGDGVNAAQQIQVAHSRIDNDGAVFGTPAALPPTNLLVNGSDNHFLNVILANAAVANLRDAGSGNNFYVSLHALGQSPLPGSWNAQYGYWISGAAVLLGCAADGVNGASTASSVGGVNGAGIRVDGGNTRVIGAKIRNLSGGAVGILLTAGGGGAAPGNCYIAGNQIDIGSGGVTDATQAVVQLGTPGAGTIITDNPGAALQQGSAGVVASGVRAIVPAASGTTSYTVAPADPQTLCLAQAAAADVVVVLPATPNLGARYRAVRLPVAGGAGVLRVRPAGAPANGSGDVAVLASAAAFAELEWDGALWRMTAQGSLDATQLSLSGNLSVAGSASLQAATGVTPPRADNSTNLATTAYVKAQNYLAAANNLADLASAAAARTSLGLGSLALQNAGSVAVSGGAIDGTVLGGSVAAAGTFTTVTASTATLPGLVVSGGTLTAGAVAISGGTIDAVTLGTTTGIGAIKAVGKAQLFEAAWETGPFVTAGGAGANDTLTLVNASGAHLTLWSPDKTMGWGLNIDAVTGNLRLLRIAGGGTVVLGNGAAVTVGGNLTVSGTMSVGTAATKLGFFGQTARVQPVVTGSRGGNAALASLLAALAGLGLIVDGSTA